MAESTNLQAERVEKRRAAAAHQRRRAGLGGGALLAEAAGAVTVAPLDLPSVPGLPAGATAELSVDGDELLKVALDGTRPQVAVLLAELRPDADRWRRPVRRGWAGVVELWRTSERRPVLALVRLKKKIQWGLTISFNVNARIPFHVNAFGAFVTNIATPAMSAFLACTLAPRKLSSRILCS